MAFSFLLTGWQDSVRRASGDVSSTDISDALLADDIYAVESEDFVKQKITDWASLLPAKASELHRATVFHLAAKVCALLAKKQPKRVTTAGGYYTRELQQIDWEQEERKNLNFCYQQMDLAKPGVMQTVTVIVISAPSTPMFTELDELFEDE